MRTTWRRAGWRGDNAPVLIAEPVDAVGIALGPRACTAWRNVFAAFRVQACRDRCDEVVQAVLAARDTAAWADAVGRPRVAAPQVEFLREALRGTA